MARYEQSILKMMNKSADFMVFLVAFLLGCVTRYYVGFGMPLFEKFNLESLTTLFFLFTLLNYFALHVSSVYPMTRLRSFEQMIWLYFKGICAALILIMALAYVVYPLTSSRFLLFFSSAYAFILVLIKEVGIRRFLKELRTAGHNLINVILIGSDAKFIRVISKEIESNHFLGLTALGVMTFQEDGRAEIGGKKNLGTIERLKTMIEENVVDCVMFLETTGERERFKEAIYQCDQRGVEIWVRLDISGRKISWIELEHLKNMPFLNYHTGPSNLTALFLKYSLDKVMSFFLLLCLLPLFLVIAIAIKITSKGPIFFKQHRAGVNGRKFIFYKFRSMENNAEQFKEALRKMNQMKGPVFKSAQDPRITPIGRFLRKYSLDELPQLLNVLKGDMSLVGPRPLPVNEAARIHGWRRRRLSMKPGITCVWQVEGRNKITDFEEWARLDLKYIDEWNLWLDFKILLKTIPAVVKGTGI